MITHRLIIVFVHMNCLSSTMQVPVSPYCAHLSEVSIHRFCHPTLCLPVPPDCHQDCPCLSLGHHSTVFFASHLAEIQEPSASEYSNCKYDHTSECTCVRVRRVAFSATTRGEARTLDICRALHSFLTEPPLFLFFRDVSTQQIEPHITSDTYQW
jgi:hypothetical protein